MKQLPEIVWDAKALAQFEKLYEYVYLSSPQNAGKLKQEIIDKIESVPVQPKKYPRDKFRKGNQGDFRAFEIHHVRIAYQITANHIFIIRVRSTHQEPMEY